LTANYSVENKSKSPSTFSQTAAIMVTINIRRDVADPFYRYKMEGIQSKIEGKGNGIKSVIVNLSSIAHSLSRDPACKHLSNFALQT